MIELQNVFYTLCDTILFLESLFILYISKIKACFKQLSSALNSIMLRFRWAIFASYLPLVLRAVRPKPTGILTEWTTTTNMSMASNLVFDWATFSKILQITNSLNRSIRLKLIPIGLSCTLTSLLLVTPTISDSLQFHRAYSNKMDKLYKKCVTGMESVGGGNNRTESWVPVAVNRLYSLLISLSTMNLFLISTLQTEIRKIINSGDKILKPNMGWSPPYTYSPDPSTKLSVNEALVLFSPCICSCFAHVFSYSERNQLSLMSYC